MRSLKGKFSSHLLALARKRIEEIRLELEFWSHLLGNEDADRADDPQQAEADPPHSASSRERERSTKG
jgi:hypothetical protein